jgi:hypothetical protein
LAAKSSGQAVGVAMKYFKEQGAFVDGNDVKVVVEEMRKAETGLASLLMIDGGL